jgi:hypothetical protein
LKRRIHRRDDKPIVEDKFNDDIDDCCNEESTARDDKPTTRTSSKTTTTTVATKNPPQGTTSLPQKTISNATTTTVTTKNLQKGTTSLPCQYGLFRIRIVQWNVAKISNSKRLGCLTASACLVFLPFRNPMVKCWEINQAGTVRPPPLQFKNSNRCNGLPHYARFCH